MLTALALAASLALPEMAPGVSYDPAVPTLRQVLGHDVGEEITSPEGVARYLEALAAAAPDRTRLIRYAESWQGRPLQVLVVGSPLRISRLDEVRAGLARLADPRGLGPAEAERLLQDLPVVVWLLHSVHGDETSCSDAALFEAYHLLAARGDAGTDAVLSQALVLVDPLQNPDGRARFLAQHLQARGPAPDPEPWAAEHDEPWPGGRGNHYLFDMNRDWIALSQPETRGRLRVFLDFFPQVVADLHEMSGDSSYYFAPPADPLNPHITEQQREWMVRFGRANAERFDERGFAYFVRDVFDSFYPGYGESWPILQGAVGMTYEQASPTGLAFRRRDGSTLTYREGVLHHFTAARATMETAARHREALLRDFLAFRRSACETSARGPREYLLPPGADEGRRQRLLELLLSQGIEVRRAEEPLALSGRHLPPGTYVVPLAQPAGRLARNLLDPEVPLEEAFLREQDRRRRKRLDDQIYDVTAWSLPLLLDVEVITSERPAAGRTTPLSLSPPPPAPAALAPARVGYLLPWGVSTAALVVEALDRGLQVRTMGEAFTLAGRRWAAGAAYFSRAENDPSLPAVLGELRSRHRAEVVPVESGFVDEGLSLGGGEARTLQPRRVLLAWDEPASSLSAGWTRHALERRFGLSLSAVRARSLRQVDLRRFDVVVLPSGDYREALKGETLAALEAWVRAGGTLVTLAEASRWAARPATGLLATRTELRGGKAERGDKGGKEGKAEEEEDEEPPGDLEEALRPRRESPERTPGALLRVALDGDHWLSAGLDDEIQVVVEGRRVLRPIRLDRGTNVGLYAPLERLVASGLVWEEAREQLARKAYLVEQPLGEGHVVAFAEDPAYRGVAEATTLLLLNSVLLSGGR